MLLDFLNENIPWRNNNVKDEVKDMKMRCLSHPEKYLWTPVTIRKFPQVIEIFNYIKQMAYEDKPDYEFVRVKLREIKVSQVNIQ